MTTYLEDRELESFNRLKHVVLAMELHRPVIFDVGANIGQSISLFKESFPQSIVYSFEPNPEVFAQLNDKWGGTQGVSLYSYALNSMSGVFPFHVTNVHEASSLMPPDQKLINLSVEKKYDSTIIDVDCITLDQFCIDNKISEIDVLKLDVQGAELEVLKGSESLIKKGNVSILYAEVNFAETYKGQMEFKDLMIFCSRYGLHLWDILPCTYTRIGRVWYANAIFVNQKTLQTIENRWK